MRGKKKTRIYNSRMGTPAGRDCYLLCSLCQVSCLAHGKQFRKCLLNVLGDRHQFTQKHTFRFILQPFRLLPFKLVKWFHTSERELSPVLPVLSSFSFRQGNTVVSMIYLNWPPHSSTLAWKIPWTEEPGRLNSRHLVNHLFLDLEKEVNLFALSFSRTRVS